MEAWVSDQSGNVTYLRQEITALDFPAQEPPVTPGLPPAFKIEVGCRPTPEGHLCGQKGGSGPGCAGAKVSWPGKPGMTRDFVQMDLCPCCARTPEKW